MSSSIGQTYTLILRSGQQVTLEDPLDQAGYLQRDFEGAVKNGIPKVGRYSIKAPPGKERDLVVRFDDVAVIIAHPQPQPPA